MNRSRQGIPEENILDLRKESPREAIRTERETEQAPETNLKKMPQRHERFSFLTHLDKEDIGTQEKKQETQQAALSSRTPKRRFHFRRNISFITSRVSYATLGVFVLFLLIIGGVFSSIRIVENARHAKGVVLGETTEGFASLERAEQALLVQDSGGVTRELEFAEAKFTTSLNQIKDIRDTYGIFLSLAGAKDDVDTAEAAIRAGRSASRLGLLLQEFISEAQADGASGYIGFMDSYQRFGAPVRLELEQIMVHLDAVDPTKLPEAYQGLFFSAQDKFSGIASALERADVMLAIFSDILGFKGERTHLLLFQNNQELRATGGFIGSVARMSVTEGSITTLEVPKGGSYDISGQVKALYKAPRPLQIVNPYFSFQDANWFADFRTSAEKILELYYDAGNSTVDGVIAFTPDVILDLLRLTGPVELNKTVSVSITEDNFLRVIRDEIEDKKNEGSTEPKKIIAELMPTLLEKAFALPLEDQLSIAFLLDEALQQKNILLYASDQQLEDQVVAAGFGGVLESPQAYDDYLAVVSSNIAGGKTDRSIEQHVTLHTTLRNGQATNEVVVTRSHMGTTTDVFSGTTNLSYVRFYTPHGSLLAATDGFYDVPQSLYQVPPRDTQTDEDLANEELETTVHEATGTRMLDMSEWTVLGNWIRVGAGETTQARISYTLPSQARDDAWSVFFQKQPGGHVTSVTWIITSDREMTSADSSLPSHATVAEHEALLSFELTDDVIVGVTFK